MAALRRAFALSASGKYLQMGIVLVANMALARLLSPAEIGTYSVAAVFAAVATSFRELGIGQYLIREDVVTEEKKRTAFTLMLGSAGLFGAALSGSAPWIARFFEEPALTTVVRIQALAFALVPFGAITLTLLRRELRFGTLMIINLASAVVHSGTAILLATQGFGPSSLAWGAVAGALATVVGAAVVQHGAIALRPCLAGARDMINFGKYVVGQSLLDLANRQIPELLIGKSLGMASLGLFTKAMLPARMFSDFVMGGLRPVLLPAFSSKVREGEYKKDYLHGLACLTGVAIPPLVLLSLLSPWVIRVLFGEQWLAAAGPLSILAVATAASSLSVLVAPMLTALNRVRVLFLITMFMAPSRLLAVFLLIPFGLKAVALGWLATGLVGAALHVYQLQRLTVMRLSEVLAAVRPSLTLTVPAAILPGVIVQWVEPSLGLVESLVTVGAAGVCATVLWVAAVFLLGHPLRQEIVRLDPRRIRPRV